MSKLWHILILVLIIVIAFYLPALAGVLASWGVPTAITTALGTFGAWMAATLPWWGSLMMAGTVAYLLFPTATKGALTDVGTAAGGVAAAVGTAVGAAAGAVASSSGLTTLLLVGLGAFILLEASRHGGAPALAARRGSQLGAAS